MKFDIFRVQNNCLGIGFLMDTEIFGFWPNLWLKQLFKEGYSQGILAGFPCPFSNHHNLGLKFTFWTFSLLKMIVLSLAI